MAILLQSKPSRNVAYDFVINESVKMRFSVCNSWYYILTLRGKLKWNEQCSQCNNRCFSNAFLYIMSKGPTYLHTEHGIKWPPYCKRHFKIHFIEWSMWQLVHTGPVYNNPISVQITARRHTWAEQATAHYQNRWRCYLLAHICFIRRWSVKTL